MSVQFEVTDTNEKSGYQVRNKIAAFKEGALPNANATLGGPTPAILQTVATGEIADGVKISGSGKDAERFLSLFDIITPNDVNLVLPPGAPVQSKGS